MSETKEPAIWSACRKLKVLADAHMTGGGAGVGKETLHLYLPRRPKDRRWIPGEVDGFKVKVHITGTIRALA